MKTYQYRILDESQNKQNLSRQSNIITQLLVKSKKKSYLTQESSDESMSGDSDLDQKMSILIREGKKRCLRSVIGGSLKLRKQKEREESRVQICQEHLCFKVLKKWKQWKDKARRQKNQAEMMEEMKNYDFFIKCFKEWKELIIKPKAERLQKKREVFQALKQACSIELDLRVKRLRIQQYLITKRAPSIISQLVSNKKLTDFKRTKAEKYYQRRIKMLSFQAINIYSKTEKKQRLRYQQYQLASLFYKKLLLSKAFQCVQKFK